MSNSILRIDASARTSDSVSRALTDRIIGRILAVRPDTTLTTRDLAQGLPQIDADWIGASFTPKEERTREQAERLALSDELIGELRAADTLVIGMPIYNFGLPSTLKAWIDLVARAGETFSYTAEGPRGLLEGKRVIVAVASGGTEVGSDIDFATDYLRHVLGFIGIDDVSFVSADRLAIDADAALSSAHEEIENLPLAA